MKRSKERNLGIRNELSTEWQRGDFYRSAVKVLIPRGELFTNNSGYSFVIDNLLEEDIKEAGFDGNYTRGSFKLFVPQNEIDGPSITLELENHPNPNKQRYTEQNWALSRFCIEEYSKTDKEAQYTHYVDQITNDSETRTGLSADDCSRMLALLDLSNYRSMRKVVR